MAPPATKKRKLSHSPVENDALSDFSSGSDHDSDSGSDLDEDEAIGSGIELVEGNDGPDSEEENLEDSWEGFEEEDSEEREGRIQLVGHGLEGSKGDITTGKKDSEHGKEKSLRKSSASEHRDLKRREYGPMDGVYTGEVYKSSMFKLQVDELLSQVKLKYGKKEGRAEAALKALKAVIEKIPDREAVSVLDAEKTLGKSDKVVIPFPNPRPPKDARYKLEYRKPVAINVVGSYFLKVASRTREEFSIDLVVTMPRTIFQEKDYMNYRYFYKRAYYVACIAAGIVNNADHNFDVTFDCLNGNHLHPIIVIKGSGDGGPDDFSSSKCNIHIIPAVPEGLFPSEKLSPTTNCVRPRHGDQAAPPKLKPTPFYNASIRADSLTTSYLKLLHGASKLSTAYQDACVLGRVWLRQRGLSSKTWQGGFGNFEWAALIALLLQDRRGSGSLVLSPGYSSYQLFKATLQFLASTDLAKEPYLISTSLAPARTYGHPILFDGERQLNLLFKMTPWSYQLLRYQARTSVSMLGESLFDQFEPTFILPEDPLLYRYDIIARLSLSTLDPSSSYDEGDNLQESYQKLYSVLTRGLGDRVNLINIALPEEGPWKVGSLRSPPRREAELLTGFIVNPDMFGRTIDRGPPAENKKEAAVFREFWGEKAELRRFKDGSILETISWPAKGDGPPIFEQIVTHILRRHMAAAVAGSISISGCIFDKWVGIGTGTQVGTAQFHPIMTAFGAMEKDIRGLEGMPLQIRHLQAADPQLRYASVGTPLLGPWKQMTRPAGVIVQFEGSGRWPDDLIAIQRTKIAFLLKLSELMQESVKDVDCRVGLENESYDIRNQSFLDIMYPNGASFRLRIHHDREETLLERRLRDKSLDSQGREDAAFALAAYKRDFLRAPAHSQAIGKLCTQYPALSPSIRLTKKWISSHLLDLHIAPELIELLVARTFLNPYPWSIPSSAQTGFLRTLFFLSRWDWRSDPLIVDLSGDMKPEEYSTIVTRHEAWRKIDPALNRIVLFAASNVDTDGTTWTDRGRPPKVVAARVTSLARAASAVVRDQGLDLDPATLFASPMAGYDFLLHLAPALTRAGQRKKSAASDRARFKNLQLQNACSEKSELERVGYEPVFSFIRELEDIYDHTIVLFYDGSGGDVIAGLWNPTLEGRKWRVGLGYSSMPLEEAGDGEMKVGINKMGALSEIARLGGDMLRRVVVVQK